MGYVGSRSAPAILLEGLRRLEYRGYDSAGIALLMGQDIEIHKAEGRLENVEKLLSQDLSRLQGSVCGIGHTRWATHGKPTTQNAHPHKTGHVVLVHNGIIENYLEIKEEILAKGYHPQSETDSELLGFLILAEMENGLSLESAIRACFALIHGQCSVVVMSEREPGVVIGVRNGSPLVLAVDPQGGFLFASDAQPLLPYTQDVIFLEHGDLVVATGDQFRIVDMHTGKLLKRTFTHLEWSADQIDKGGFPHFMLKEIYEQPGALVDTLNGVLDRTHADLFVFEGQPGVDLLKNAKELVFLACGTSWHAALIGKYWIESLARIPVSVELASEFRYRQPVLRPGTLVIGISQSGETADTLAALRELRKKNIPCLGISNVRRSTISRDADAVFYTSAGPEIGVAATKTFTSQLLVLLLMAGFLSAQKKARDSSDLSRLFADLVKLPHLMSIGLDENSHTVMQVKKTIDALSSPEAGDSAVRGFFFMGRGYSFPIALEAALKLKEIAYDHAEGYAAGELKHGPIAMMDRDMVVVVLAPKDSWRDKTVSNLSEVKARGAKIIGVGHAGDLELSRLCDFWIPFQKEADTLHPDLVPFLLSPIIQLLSYYRAARKGADIDKPRNLAKSVTVE
jgi:glucosamine--fructose-6-phosphate aminotransferase (isomerizing)